jgi:DNA-directed RNA polymerase subunit RPC12/RpoP
MTDDAEPTRSSGWYACDRCGAAIALREALITGEVENSEEIVCPDCTTPEDRIITDGEDR